MVVMLYGADFSKKNIGKIDVTVKIDAFTTAAIYASGNTSMTFEQKVALNSFFKSLGAFGTESNIWEKIEICYIPFLANSIETMMVDYKNNNVDFNPNPSYWTALNRGIKPIPTVPVGSGFKKEGYVFDQNNKSIIVLNTEPIIYSGTSTQSSIGVGTSATSSLNSYKNWGFNSSGKDNDKVAVSVRFGAGPQAYPINALTSESEDNTLLATRAISCDGSNINVLFGEKTYSTIELSDAQIAQRDTAANNLFVFGSWTTESIAANKTACGALMLGQYLTKDEMIIVKDSLDKLWSKFIDL